MNNKFKIIFFIFMLALLLYSNFRFDFSSKNITLFKKNVFANNCSSTKTGIENTNVKVSIKASDVTSGFSSLQCHNSSTNYWDSCVESTSSCNDYTYVLAGWNYYDKVRSYDNAGILSKEYTLPYERESIILSGDNLRNSNIFESIPDKNAIYVYNETNTTGSVNSYDYTDSGVRVNGTASSYWEDVSSPTYTLASTGKYYNCDTGGTLTKLNSSYVGDEVFVNGNSKKITNGDINNYKYICTAKNYRLQNGGCYVLFHKVNGKWEPFSSDSAGCIGNTKCSDEYGVSGKDTFSVITTQEANLPSTLNSNHFQRTDGVCYTYYHTVSQLFVNSWYNNKYFSGSNGYLESAKNTYPTPAYINSTTKNVMVDASSGRNPCDNTSQYYISASKMGDIRSKVLNDRYNYISENKYMSYSSSSNSEKIYIVPIISSANCKWKTYFADKANLPTNAIVDGAVYYYCRSGETPVLVNDTYKCSTTTTPSYEIRYEYNWKIDYYRKK